jgi:hypothetical protein
MAAPSIPISELTLEIVKSPDETVVLQRQNYINQFSEAPIQGACPHP